MNKGKYFVVLLTFFASISLAGSFDFGVTEEFCKAHFNGKIAFANEPYNSTDVVDSNLPNRRVLGEFVTSTVASIWYEHGGRGYHQHLVQFETSHPHKVVKNYILNGGEYNTITDIIDNIRTLKASSETEL